MKFPNLLNLVIVNNDPAMKNQKTLNKILGLGLDLGNLEVHLFNVSFESEASLLQNLGHIHMKFRAYKDLP